ncbi:MAG TPA: AMP-binding protein, partial [Acidimicrobiales bacterium]|nr:AMP-binding protein [Acidimicrobiales bacterium]
MVRERGAKTHVVAPPEVAKRVAEAPQPGEAPLPADDVPALLRRNATDPDISGRPALRFGDRIWTHAELFAESERFAQLFRSRLDPGRPKHVAVLLDNTPDYVFALCGTALAGAVLVGLNNTRRDEHLARDIGYTDVQLIVTEPRQLHLLETVRGDLDVPGGLLVSSRFRDAD